MMMMMMMRTIKTAGVPCVSRTCWGCATSTRWPPASWRTCRKCWSARRQRWSNQRAPPEAWPQVLNSNAPKPRGKQKTLPVDLALSSCRVPPAAAGPGEGSAAGGEDRRRAQHPEGAGQHHGNRAAYLQRPGRPEAERWRQEEGRTRCSWDTAAPCHQTLSTCFVLLL